MEPGDSYHISFLVGHHEIDAYVTEYYDDDYYLAGTIPACPGLLATGDTLDELIIDLVECYVDWWDTRNRLDGNIK